ncbi:hypothetical protein [Methylopila turkensis]|uniref:DUF2946 domain-containing protein n=1 Tax=Methylopila turkensis TaxID=1437816 RepID=A0A9W6JJ91_9HYPH|nr:hypothetical protein [Methylopila turkensis]GLK78691.1 hypothetical protein GCM10008174_04320 [Methylopila turkensis]
MTRLPRLVAAVALAYALILQAVFAAGVGAPAPDAGGHVLCSGASVDGGLADRGDTPGTPAGCCALGCWTGAAFGPPDPAILSLKLDVERFAGAGMRAAAPPPRPAQDRRLRTPRAPPRFG